VRAVLDLTDGQGVDVAIEASGGLGVPQLCAEVTKRGGKILFVAFYSDSVRFDLSAVVRKDITMYTSRGEGRNTFNARWRWPLPVSCAEKSWSPPVWAGRDRRGVPGDARTRGRSHEDRRRALTCQDRRRAQPARSAGCIVRFGPVAGSLILSALVAAVPLILLLVLLGVYGCARTGPR